MDTYKLGHNSYFCLEPSVPPPRTQHHPFLREKQKLCPSSHFLCSKFSFFLLLLFFLIPTFSAVPGPSAALTTMQLFSKQNPSRQEVTKLQQQVKANGAGVTVLKREISELRTKVQEQQKQLQDQDQKLLEQTQIIGEQNARLAELERKLREVMESAVGSSSGSGSNEQSPRKRRKAVESTDCPRKSKRLRNRK